MVKYGRILFYFREDYLFYGGNLRGVSGYVRESIYFYKKKLECFINFCVMYEYNFFIGE